MNRVKQKSRKLLLFVALATSTLPLVARSSPFDLRPLSGEAIHQRTVERRAVELAIWGIPLVNFDGIIQSMERAGGHTNEIAVWTRPSNWTNQLLTPNSEVLYAIPFINTKDAGPMVLEIPPADGGTINGSIMDAWQSAVEDVGIAGADKGKGGKYLILPPGYQGQVPDGYIVVPSQTFQGFALLRSIPRSHSEADIAAAGSYVKRVKLYPLSTAESVAETKFVDVTNIEFDGAIPYDLRFFEALDRMVQIETVQARDKMMYSWLASIGIEKGKRFAPDNTTKTILLSSLHEAHQWFVNRFLMVPPRYYPGRQWFFPAEPGVSESHGTFELGDRYLTDARGTIYYFGFSNIKKPGTGQYYLLTTKDSGGRFLDGGTTYRLTVPPNVPVSQYWSITLYDRATHTFIRGVELPTRSSLEAGLQKNSDGSVDIYFGPKAPARRAENWIPTKSGGTFEVMFRAYGPTKPLFDKTWQLEDIARVR